MSIYIGEGSSGKKQVHLTNATFTKEEMKGAPREGTTFHSDLTYVTVLDTIVSYEDATRRSLGQGYMDQGYVFKRLFRSFTPEVTSWMPGSVGTFKTAIQQDTPQDTLTDFITWTQTNPARGWFSGAADEGPSQWGPANGPQSTDGAFIVVEAQASNYMELTVGYSGDYVQGSDSGNVYLKSTQSGRSANGVATIRGRADEYDELNNSFGAYDPWNNPSAFANRRDYLFLNVKKDGSSYSYTNENNDPGSAGIWITRDDLTVGDNYSMRNTAVMADLGGSKGTVGWNSSQNDYFVNVPYLRSTVPLTNSPLWDFFNEVYKVGTPYTETLDSVTHLMDDLEIFVDANFLIVGWQVRPGNHNCLVNIDPAGLLGVGSGLEMSDDTITMEGTGGRSLTIASPVTELLQLPAEPVVVVAPAITNYTYGQISNGMTVKSTFTGAIDTWVNRGDSQDLYAKSELIGAIDFPPSLKGNVDTTRVMLDFKWGDGPLQVSKGGYTSSSDIDHKVIHSPITLFWLYRTPGVNTRISELASHYFLTSEINTYNVGASQQPTNDTGNKLEGVSCTYSLYVDWDNEQFLLYREWEGQSGDFYWSYYSYNQTIYSKVYAYTDGECRYWVPECKVSVYVLSAVDNDYTITPKP